MAEFNLLEKTELRIERISLCRADLNDVAAVVADVLRIGRQEVLVTDVQDNCMTIDLLRKAVDPYTLVGKKDLLFEKLSQLPGVEISEETSVCSQGMLGWIALDEAEAELALKRSEEMAEELDADSVNYMPIDEYIKETGMRRDQLCVGCISNQYPTPQADKLASNIRHELAKGGKEKGRAYE